MTGSKIIEVFSQTNVAAVYYNGNTTPQSLAFSSAGVLYGSANSTIVTFPRQAVLVTTSTVSFSSSVESRPIHLGGANNATVAGINLTNAELARISTNSGTVTFGDSDQTGNVTIAAATFAATPVGQVMISQSATGPGAIVFDDGNGSAPAFVGNGGYLSLTAGIGGITSASARNDTADIANVYSAGLSTNGSVGTPTNPIQFADNNGNAPAVSVGSQYGATYLPTGVYLEGLGNLALYSVAVSPTSPIKVNASGNLTVNGYSTIASFGGTVSLAADLTWSGSGDDGIGTLTIGASAYVYAPTINLRGANLAIAPTANVGDGRHIQGATLTGLEVPGTIAFDSAGNLYVANLRNGTVSEFAPGSSVPTRTLTDASTGGNLFPQVLTFGPDGKLYVASSDTVSVFNPGATSPSATLTGLKNPAALEFDSTGNLYVADDINNTVSVYAPGGLSPTKILTGLMAPDAMAFDSHGNLYVANRDASTVSIFTPGSTTPTSTLTSGISGPTTLAFDSSGNLFVGNGYGSTILKFAPALPRPAPHSAA